MEVLSFVAGMALLVCGAEALVRGASRLAAMFGMSQLTIGLTVVAFGTSAPELAVSIDAALSGQGSIAVGNVVGSNILNVLFTLGLSALIVPLMVARQLVRFDVPLMIVLSIVVWVLALDHRIGRLDGLLLVAALLAYIGSLLWFGREQGSRAEAASPEVFPAVRRGWVWNAVAVVGGLGLLVLGSHLFVASAVSFAEQLGVSEAVVGLTIAAAGTSMPEVVTAVVAAARGERDIAVGNVVGSNVLNLLSVLGLASLVSPGGIAVPTSVVNFDIPVMTASAFACLPIFFTGGVISRAEGALFLAYYVAYTLYLVLDVTEHDALPRFSTALAGFALPLTLLTLAVLAIQEARRRAVGRGE